MGELLPLGTVLRERLGAATVPDPEILERALETLVEKGEQACPGASLGAREFIEYLAARLPPEGGDLGRCLARIHGADLYLACACVQGDRAALEAFEREYLSQVPSFLGGMSPTPLLVGDVQQSLREQLLVRPPDGREPRLASYSGRGPLTSWLRVAAIRAAIHLRSRDLERRSVDIDSLREEPLPGADPELDYIKMAYADEFRRAFQGALAKLTGKERTVLRFYLCDGLNIEKIGTFYGVHRATVARWIARARESLLAATREHLREQLCASDSELESLVRILHRDVDVSIRRYLQPERE